MKYLYKRIPEIILLVYVGLFLGFKDTTQPWDRVINSDGKGYYAYLPAMFIYHDWKYQFVDQYEAQYYPSNRSVYKEFRNQTDGSTVNKYFPGLAVVWLPFFLFGHMLAWLEKMPMDGYSLPYQWAIAISALMFLWLGARWLRKLLLSFGAEEKHAAFITLAVTLGTNLIFYSIVEASMTHVYTFALVTVFLLNTYRFFHEYQPKWFVRSLLLFILIVMIRPTNALIILLVPFVAGSNAVLAGGFRRVTGEPLTLLRAGIQAMVLLAIPFVLWRLQTGQWFVYSYGEEKLNFLAPHMLNILFSFNRGWFIYTPLALVAMLGLAGLFRESRYRFAWMTAFLVLFIYVASCWWVWYYASKCGQRVFVDIYAVTGLLLLFLFRNLRKNLLRNLLSLVITLMIGLNLFQFYQHARWIYPPSYITAGIFRDSFLSVHQRARVYLPADGIVGIQYFGTDLERDPGWMNPATRTTDNPHQGKFSSRADKAVPYSIGLDKKLEGQFSTGNRIIRTEAWVFAPGETTEASLIADFQLEGKSVSYNAFYLEKFARVGQWTQVQAAIYVPAEFPQEGSVKIYFYNPSKNYPLYVDDIKIDFISMKEDPDFRKIEGVELPEKVTR